MSRDTKDTIIAMSVFAFLCACVLAFLAWTITLPTVGLLYLLGMLT